MITLTLDGIPEMQTRLTGIVTSPLEPLYQALRHEGNMIIVQAQALVPVDTGLLRSTLGVDTGGLETPRVAGGPVEVTLRGGAHGTAPYAAFVEFDVPHRAHVHGGQAHFLQQPLFAATGGLTGRLAAALAGAIQGTGP
jgi:hypothetical protein